jgi:RNA polymerase sigma factor (TIGR02999 family)
MEAPEADEITQLLDAVRAGDARAEARLIELTYPRLHREAQRLLLQERDADSLQTTALLHEAFIKGLVGELLHQAPNRAYFFAAMARLMRQTLVEHARRRRAEKRGGGLTRVPIDALLDYFQKQNLDVQALHDALEVLASEHPRPALVFTLRFVGGLTAEEVARHLQVSLSTAEKDTHFARAWLRKELGGDARVQ